MSPRRGPARRLRQVADANPLQGGLTGIALVALATLGLAFFAALICVVILWLIG